MTAFFSDFRTDGPAEPRWSVMIALSLLLHAGVLCGVIFYPSSIPTRTISGPVYEVSLVDMPASVSARPGQRVGVATAAEPETETAAVPVASPELPEAPAVTETAPARRIETPRAPEKPAVIAKRTVETPAPAVPEPRVDTSRLVDRKQPVDPKRAEPERRDPSALISDAVSKIQSEVDERRKEDSLIGEAIARLETRQVEADTGPGIGGAAGAAAGGRGGDAVGRSIRARLYEIQVKDLIMSNWTYPMTLDSLSGDPRAEVIMRVRSDGSIVNYSIRRKSANPRFDESVLKAVERSDPLPPFPDGFRKQEEIVLNFNLSDLRR